MVSHYTTAANWLKTQGVIPSLESLSIVSGVQNGLAITLSALMIVRIAVGKDLDEATERRVAFEVVEWVRGGSFREESSKA